MSRTLALALTLTGVACGSSTTSNYSANNDGRFLVTPSVDAHTTASPAAPQSVATGATQAFTVTAQSSWRVSPTVGGTCPTGTWSGSVYTTGAIEVSCSVSFTSVSASATVSATAGAHVSAITPATPVVVDAGATAAFTVAADGNYVVSTAVTGTCAAGTWDGNVYTTGAVDANCQVDFSAVPKPLTVAANVGNFTIAETALQHVGYGSGATFTVTANAN